MNKFSRTLQRWDAFPKVEGAYQARSASGGVLSVIVALILLFIVGSEVRDYFRYTETHTFLVDGEISHKLQINFALSVAMPCNLLRVDVLDEGGTNQNVLPTIKTSPVSKKDAFARVHDRNKFNNIPAMHVHDIVNKARQKQRISKVSKHEGSADSACRLEGSVHVNRISGLLHITAYGHGHGGFHVPHDMMNFTHYIEELSFGPFYPSLVNPLDDTMHKAETTLSSFKYFVSVVPTIYIDGSSRILSTNQYAVNEYYFDRLNKAAKDDQPPGIFVEYDIEPISVTVRETRTRFIAFFVRLCAAVSGIFITVGLLHRFVYTLSGGKNSGRASQSSTHGLLGAKAASKAEVDAPFKL